MSCDWSATVLVAELIKIDNGKRGRLPLQSGRSQIHERFLLTTSHFFFIIHFNTGKEVIQKYMSSNHSEVAET